MSGFDEMFPAETALIHSTRASSVEVVRVDISARAQQSSNVFLTREDLEDWEKSHGRIPDGSVVILYSNWGQHHQNPYAYYGSSTPMDATTVSYPGFHPEAAKWLIESRRIHGVGTDCVSIESPKTVGHTVHRLFAAENLFNLEQLAHVDLLPPNGSYIIVGPMKIRGGSGGPARVYALKPPFDAAEAALFRAATKDAVIDLAHDLSENTVRWPNGRMFQLTVEPPPPHKYFEPALIWVPACFKLLKYSFCSPEHIGTHLDAPIHFSKDGLSSADIEIQHFIADGIVMDVESQARGSPDFVLTDTHVTEWEAKFGRIPEGSIVFLKTGWSSKLPKMEDYYGTPDYNDTTKLHFPGYSAEAAKLLIEERSVAGLGIDTASDLGPLSLLKNWVVQRPVLLQMLELLQRCRSIYSGKRQALNHAMPQLKPGEHKGEAEQIPGTQPAGTCSGPSGSAELINKSAWRTHTGLLCLCLARARDSSHKKNKTMRPLFGGDISADQGQPNSVSPATLMSCKMAGRAVTKVVHRCNDAKFTSNLGYFCAELQRVLPNNEQRSNF
ncbi:unnamed protein product [Notodromas monacha]|uniref:Cyclase n=1 Tax=Notodromas monacha TaxID=399045 RepID=A0A7R9GEB7_9CRUS|nr:unnamed protein product [Notodromas monacha]CAG0918097.1 unnamed protein product [Notodromas monacha]